ncbi:hypothetical protein Deba_1501 [Desulfarculus baarsii DSM 2075]|uniref:Solitary outer membrane autotransporter-like beta-barrel domain-containing protein n=1 Tax=Desulfarculus baarsii (strain ATCC 33931 / DSM 2075 / LMG 7858 / VKM B-1802 / 2st14) TaxID=644282 RepID=E1QH26_DESB2|nr:hypothetical protein Deba_1501 [Desulfarculus baarsii DSM 2075]
MSVRRFHVLLFACCLTLGACLIGGPARAELSQDERKFLHEIYREQTRRDVGFFKVLAGLTNMVLSPDLSSAFLRTDDDEYGVSGVRFSSTKLPFYHTFKSEKHDWSIFAGLTLGYLNAAQDIDAPAVFNDQDERLAVNSRWKGYSGNVEAGLNYPLGLGFTVSPSLGFGLAQLRNSVDYLNAFGKNELAPIIDGVTANFYVDTLNYSAGLALAYDLALGPVDLQAKAKYSYVYTQAYDSTDEVQRFHEHTGVASGRLQLRGPTGLSPWGLPLGWELFTAQNWLPDIDKEVLGFTYYCEFGGALAVEIAKAGLPVRALKLGGSGLVGDGVSGWSLILGYSF